MVRTPSQSGRACRRWRRGLSLPEAMISLAITSMLLVAVATAFSASCTVVEANDKFFRSSQAGRVALNQLLLDIRNTTSLPAANVTSTSVIVSRPPFVPGGGQLVYAMPSPQNPSATETQRQYAYDATNHRVTLQIAYSDGTTSPLYELAGNVSAFTFGTPDTMVYNNNATVAIRIPVSLTVSAAGANVTLNGAAGPRTYLTY
jgi:Tfp pilus assembly protein PilW